MSPFLNLPNEILLQVFYALHSTGDAVRLSRTCSRLYDLFKNRKTKINILRFADNLPNKFSSDSKCVLSECVRIPPSKWWLRDKEDYLITLTIDYSGFSDEVISNNAFRDMATIYNGRPRPEFQSPIHEFLSQFDKPELRAGNYEYHTLPILKMAVRHQKDILSEMPVMPEDLSSHDMVIALLLNCFVISHQIYILCAICPSEAPGDGDTYDITLQNARRGHFWCIPFMAIHRQRPTSSLPESLTNTAWDLGGTLKSAMQLAAQLLLEMLVKQDQRDLPRVLHALCLMCLVRDHVDFEVNILSWQEFFDVGDPLVPDLSRLYYIFSNGGEPFTHSFDRGAYATLVDDDQIAIKYCDSLQARWLDYSSKGNGHLNSFGEKVHSFVCDWWEFRYWNAHPIRT